MAKIVITNSDKYVNNTPKANIGWGFPLADTEIMNVTGNGYCNTTDGISHGGTTGLCGPPLIAFSSGDGYSAGGAMQPGAFYTSTTEQPLIVPKGTVFADVHLLIAGQIIEGT